MVRAHLAAVDAGRSGEGYLLTGEHAALADFVGEIAQISVAKAPMTAPAWVLKIYGRLSVMIAAFTGKEPDVTPELATAASTKGRVFRCDKAIRELGYQITPMSVSVRDTYDWLVKEGLLTS